MSELNPNHPVTRGLHDHWHKLCAILMVKLGVSSVRITEGELLEICSRTGLNIVADERGGALTLRLVDDEEAAKLAKEAGGLPI